MGNEFSGIVKEVGASVRAFEVGDRVYGRMPLSKIGAFAEYAAVDAGALAQVPDYLSLEEAAAVPLTVLTATQAFELMDAKPGQTVFISGGTGYLGAMAIPVAKSLGLTVATNGNGMNEERVRALGADVFIDYKKQNYTDVLADVDLVLDTLGDRELPSEFAVLKEGGRLVSLRGMPNGRFARRMGMPWYKPHAPILRGPQVRRHGRTQTPDLRFRLRPRGRRSAGAHGLPLPGRPSADGVDRLHFPP